MNFNNDFLLSKRISIIFKKNLIMNDQKQYDVYENVFYKNVF